MAVLWEESKAELAQQNSDVDALRNRSVALLSAGTLVGGLFGTRLPGGHPSKLNTFGLVAALILFVASVVLTIAIAWPQDWKAGPDRIPLAEQVADGNADVAVVHYSLLRSAEGNWAANHVTMTRMYKLFGGLCFLAGVEVVAWALAVI